VSRLSIKEAADRLRVSEITVRRRLHNGELEGEQEETPQGFRWVVLLPDGVADDDSTDQAASSAPGQATTPAVDHELLTELRGQVTYLKQEIEDRKAEHSRDRDDWRGELERLHTLMAQQGQTLQTLTRTVEALPVASESTAPAPVRSGAEKRLHLYLTQSVPPLTTVLLSLIGPLVGGIITVAAGWGWSGAAERVPTVLITLSYALLLLVLAVGPKLVVAQRRQLVAEGVVTWEELRQQNMWERVWSWPLVVKAIFLIAQLSAIASSVISLMVGREPSMLPW
jgi:hypothetical protein